MKYVTDGTRIPNLPGVPPDIECYDCEEYGIALWDPKGNKHTVVSRDFTDGNVKAALRNMGALCD